VTGVQTCALPIYGKSARFARILRDELRFLPGIGTADSKQAVSLSLRQFMVTPEDITVEGPQFDDIPYAGHLSLSGTLWSWNADTITGFGAHIGVIGPESGAERSEERRVGKGWRGRGA